MHTKKSAAGAYQKMSHVSVFEHRSSSGCVAQMCGSSPCCCLVNTHSIGGFQTALLCGLFFSVSQLAAAGDAEAPQRQVSCPCHQELSTVTCGIQASASESWQWLWTLMFGQAESGMYPGGWVVIVGWNRRNCGKLLLWCFSSQREGWSPTQ